MHLRHFIQYETVTVQQAPVPLLPVRYICSGCIYPVVCCCCFAIEASPNLCSILCPERSPWVMLFNKLSKSAVVRGMCTFLLPICSVLHRAPHAHPQRRHNFSWMSRISAGDFCQKADTNKVKPCHIRCSSSESAHLGPHLSVSE